MRLATIILIGLLLIGFTYNSEQPTAQDIESYQLPGFKDIELGNPILIRDTSKALRLGMLAFHAPLGSRHGSCAGCHNIEKAGFSNEPIPNGNMGLFDELLSKYQPVKLDKPDLKTPAVINSWSLKNTLWGAELGSKGLNTEIPLTELAKFKPQNSQNIDGVYIQADVGINAHEIGAMVEKCRQDTFFTRLSQEAFYTEDVTKQIITTAIGIYEKSIIPNESNFQFWLMGKSEKLKSEKGFELFKDNCITCHTGKAFGNETLGMAIGNSSFEGRKRLTGKQSDYRIVKVPQLYNLKDAPSYFHNSEDITLYKAIKKHNLGLTRKEIYRIKKFLEKDLHDSNLKRFLEY